MPTDKLDPRMKQLKHWGYLDQHHHDDDTDDDNHHHDETGDDGDDDDDNPVDGDKLETWRKKNQKGFQYREHFDENDTKSSSAAYSIFLAEP